MQPQKQHDIIAIVGPTASGKTRTAIDVARYWHGEVISADARQVYRGLDIGTDKVQDTQGVPHHCIDVADPAETFTAADFKQCGQAAIRDIESNGNVPIVAGGTGFWIDALFEHITVPEVPPDAELRQRLSSYSNEELLRDLSHKAPHRAETIEPDNQRRLIRALEIYEHLGYIPQPRTSSDSPYRVCWVGLDRTDAEYHERLPERARQWLAAGFRDEVQRLMERQLPEERWREFGFEYQLGRDLVTGTTTEEQFIELFIERNMQYIKRQRKYFRRNERIEWFHPDQRESLGAHLAAFSN